MVPATVRTATKINTVFIPVPTDVYKRQAHDRAHGCGVHVHDAHGYAHEGFPLYNNGCAHVHERFPLYLPPHHRCV